jgi:hypothetical protein
MKFHQNPQLRSRRRVHIRELHQGKVLQRSWNSNNLQYKYCKDHGIVQQFTIPHTPQQNGVVERKNITLEECARSMMKCKNLSNVFWDETISTVVYLKNRSPTRCLDHKTHFEALYDNKPTVNNLRIFGCKAFSHIPKENRNKLDVKSIKCIFIGYCSEFKAYKQFDPSTHKVFASRDVFFHEQAEVKPDWWQKGIHRKRALIMQKHLHQ